jgi:ribonuclease-3
MVDFIDHIQEKINYIFKNTSYLKMALTHSSYANEKSQKFNNERLEFLGDAVLELVISEEIFRRFPNLPEGEMTRVRANVVCEPSLVKQSNILDLGNFIYLGKGEEISGGRFRSSILADVFESLVGSIYLDGGLEPAKGFILDNLSRVIEEAANNEIILDYKTRLQELIQKQTDKKLSYKIENEIGPPHDKTFYVKAYLGKRVIGKGKGKSKKDAEQQAAKEGYEIFIKAGETVD